MEKEYKEKINDEKTTDPKKYKKKKSVNWETKIIDEKEIPKEPEKKTEKENVPFGNDKEYLEIEVINKDGSTKIEKVKYEKKNTKDFEKKREEKSHDEYTKAKEFLEKHQNDE